MTTPEDYETRVARLEAEVARLTEELEQLSEQCKEHVTTTLWCDVEVEIDHDSGISARMLVRVADVAQIGVGTCLVEKCGTVLDYLVFASTAIPGVVSSTWSWSYCDQHGGRLRAEIALADWLAAYKAEPVPEAVAIERIRETTLAKYRPK